MTPLLGIAVLFLVVGIWAYAEHRGLDPFGKDDDDSGYADPAMPRVVERTSPPPRDVQAPGYVGTVSRTSDSEASGYGTTTLRRMK